MSQDSKQYHPQDNHGANDDNESDDSNEMALDISVTDSIDTDTVDTFYDRDNLISIMTATLSYIDTRIAQGLSLPYFADIDPELWQQKSKTLEIYITDEDEGRALNLDARGKDHPTNILSYPSELPSAIIDLMPVLPLGELIVCHQVMVREATEQHKTVAQHISHLLIHGILHLLGFDHELGQAEQDEMERFEIEILASLNLPNPYE